MRADGAQGREGRAATWVWGQRRHPRRCRAIPWQGCTHVINITRDPTVRTNQRQRQGKSLGLTLGSSKLGLPSMTQRSKQRRPKKPPPRPNSELQKRIALGERANSEAAEGPCPPAIITPRINLIDSNTTAVQSYSNGPLIFIRLHTRKNGLYDMFGVIYVMVFNSGSWQKPDNNNLVN